MLVHAIVFAASCGLSGRLSGVRLHVGFLHHLLVSDFLKLHVLLDHHLLEGLEVVDVEDLLDDFVVGRVGGALLASRLELFSCDPHFSH